MTFSSSRFLYFSGFITVCLLLAGAELLEMCMNIAPCPLCIFQRLFFALLGIIFFFGAVINLRSCGRAIVGFFSIFISSLGIIFAGRQAWIQHFPVSESGDCGASLHYLLSAYPLREVIYKVFIGGADCSRVDWQLLGFSLADWSLLFFIAFFLLGVFECVFALRYKSKHSLKR